MPLGCPGGALGRTGRTHGTPQGLLGTPAGAGRGRRVGAPSGHPQVSGETEGPPGGAEGCSDPPPRAPAAPPPLRQGAPLPRRHPQRPLAAACAGRPRACASAGAVAVEPARSRRRRHRRHGAGPGPLPRRQGRRPRHGAGHAAQTLQGPGAGGRAGAGRRRLAEVYVGLGGGRAGGGSPPRGCGRGARAPGITPHPAQGLRDPLEGPAPAPRGKPAAPRPAPLTPPGWGGPCQPPRSLAAWPQAMPPRHPPPLPRDGGRSRGGPSVPPLYKSPAPARSADPLAKAGWPLGGRCPPRGISSGDLPRRDCGWIPAGTGGSSRAGSPAAPSLRLGAGPWGRLPSALHVDPAPVIQPRR